MTLNEFYEKLKSVNASRESRLKYANLVLNDMQLFPKLVDILFMVDDKTSSRAAWVLEFVCKDYIFAIVPYLDTFTSHIKTIKLDASVRPVSKICTLIAETYYDKQPNVLKKILNSKQKELIVEASFDWLINDEKIATKAHAMDTLFLFGKDFKWIHPELVQILEQDFQNQSPGFKARAKQILKKIKASS
jgi:hypothetical protein